MLVGQCVALVVVGVHLGLHFSHDSGVLWLRSKGNVDGVLRGYGFGGSNLRGGGEKWCGQCKGLQC